MLEDGIFEIRLDYKPATGSADRVFLAMAEYVNAFEEIVHVVGHSIDPDADFSYQLSAVEKGSIKAVLNCASIIKSFSKTLSKIPEYIANSMVELDEINSEKDIEKIVTHLEDRVRSSMEIRFPNELNINRLHLAKGVKKLVKASEKLIDGETVDIKSNNNNLVYLNTKIRFDKDPSSLFYEINKEVKKTETLLIKKPVFFGDAMWDFKSIERCKSFSAPLLDEQWLKRYQNRELPHIDPGDAIIALVSYEAHKEKGAKNFSFSNHKILHVEHHIRSEELQINLDIEYNSDEA